MIDPMVQTLNDIAPTLALADDLVSVCYNEGQLYHLICTLERCCKERSFVINKKKSAIIEVRQDRRQPARTGFFKGYPFVDTYKYLGVHFDSCLKLCFDVAEKKSRQEALRRQQWLLTYGKITG